MSLTSHQHMLQVMLGVYFLFDLVRAASIKTVDCAANKYITQWRNQLDVETPTAKQLMFSFALVFVCLVNSGHGCFFDVCVSESQQNFIESLIVAVCMCTGSNTPNIRQHAVAIQFVILCDLFPEVIVWFMFALKSLYGIFDRVHTMGQVMGLDQTHVVLRQEYTIIDKVVHFFKLFVSILNVSVMVQIVSSSRNALTQMFVAGVAIVPFAFLWTIATEREQTERIMILCKIASVMVSLVTLVVEASIEAFFVFQQSSLTSFAYWKTFASMSLMHEALEGMSKAHREKVRVQSAWREGCERQIQLITSMYNALKE